MRHRRSVTRLCAAEIIHNISQLKSATQVEHGRVDPSMSIPISRESGGAALIHGHFDELLLMGALCSRRARASVRTSER